MVWRTIDTLTLNKRVRVKGKYTNPKYYRNIDDYPLMMKRIVNGKLDLSTQFWNGAVGITHWWDTKD